MTASTRTAAVSASHAEARHGLVGADWRAQHAEDHRRSEAGLAGPWAHSHRPEELSEESAQAPAPAADGKDMPTTTAPLTARQVAARFAVAARPLQANMVRLYVESELDLRDPATMDVTFVIARRNHARQTLVARCGFTPEQIARIRSYAGLDLPLR